MGLYRPDDSPTQNYLNMEQKFLQFATAINVRPTILDTLIWRQMKYAGSIVLKLLKKHENEKRGFSLSRSYY
jgi:thermostable 8-oxoguanine DNA glycosylase